MKKPRLTEIALLDHATSTFRTRTHRDITGQTDQEAKPNVDPLSYNKESSFFIPTMNSYICQAKEIWEMGVGRNKEVREKEG